MRLVKGIYLLAGSNLGDRYNNLQNAIHQIQQHIGPVTGRSAIYESEAWGEINQPDFFNQVIAVETNLSHEALLHTLQGIEKTLGKHKIGKWRERLIDLDILYYRNRIVRTSQLTIPHPEIQNRNFVLMPMSEIAGEDMHPLLLKSHQQLLRESLDPLKVWKRNELVSW